MDLTKFDKSTNAKITAKNSKVTMIGKLWINRDGSSLRKKLTVNVPIVDNVDCGWVLVELGEQAYGCSHTNALSTIGTFTVVVICNHVSKTIFYADVPTCFWLMYSPVGAKKNVKK